MPLDKFLYDLLSSQSSPYTNVHIVEDNAKLCATNSSKSTAFVEQASRRLHAEPPCRWSSCDKPLLAVSQALIDRRCRWTGETPSRSFLSSDLTAPQRRASHNDNEAVATPKRNCKSIISECLQGHSEEDIESELDALLVYFEDKVEERRHQQSLQQQHHHSHQEGQQKKKDKEHEFEEQQQHKTRCVVPPRLPVRLPSLRDL